MLRERLLNDRYQHVRRDWLPQRPKDAGGRPPAGAGHDNDRNVSSLRVRRDFTVHVDAADMRQIKIEDDRVGQLLLDRAQPGQAVARGDDGKTRQAQRVVEQLPRGAVILDSRIVGR